MRCEICGRPDGQTEMVVIGDLEHGTKTHANGMVDVTFNLIAKQPKTVVLRRCTVVSHMLEGNTIQICGQCSEVCFIVKSRSDLRFYKFDTEGNQPE